MIICRNAEGVHGQRKFGDPCYRWIRPWISRLSNLINNVEKQLLYCNSLLSAILKKNFAQTTKIDRVISFDKQKHKYIFPN